MYSGRFFCDTYNKCATSSEKGGSGNWDYGKYPSKIYTIDGVLIYQAELGGNNTNQIPLGGVVVQNSDALSMTATIANPITYYGGSTWTVINQTGHSGDLYNYYWTSYSRGVDGAWNSTKWHNVYLDGYIPLRVKSIYDPCPYLYRIPSNGTWNQFGPNAGWTVWSYLAGASWNLNTLGESWLVGLGFRDPSSAITRNSGNEGQAYSSTVAGETTGYFLSFYSSNIVNVNYYIGRSYGFSVRCIEGTGR